MSFPRYPAYKDSGVEWLGSLPISWNVSRLGFEAWVRARLGWKGLKAEEYVDAGFIFLATPNIKEANIDFENVNYISEDRYEESPEIKLAVGDVLLAKDGSTLGTVNVVKVLPGPATVNSSIAVITPHASTTGQYLRFVFNSSYMGQVIQKTKGGMGVPHLFQADLNKFYIPLPPVPEQEAIARFLDHETAKIDALVAEQERLIELLKEKRQAVISHAVTKGLDPSVPMKDSGVEWLGEVPAHWEVARVKHLVQTFEQGWSPQCESFPVGSESEWGILKVGCVNGGIFNPEENKALPPDLTPLPELGISAGDLLISRANTRELVGSAAVASADHHNLMLCDKLYRLRVDAGRCLPTFLSLFLGTEQVRGQIELAATGASSSMLNISQATILELCLALPPMAEQQELLQAVEVSVAQLDQLVGEAVLSVELLRERRTALISAAVTGQIDVRGWMPTETTH